MGISCKLLQVEHKHSGAVDDMCHHTCRYKAAGNSDTLLTLGAKYGLKVDIVNLLEAGSGAVAGQVSSSKIRNALNHGLMQQVSESLGRPYRLVADISTADLPGALEPGPLR